MQEDKEKSLNYSSKKVEIIGIYYLYVVKVTYMQRPVSTLNQNLRIHFGRIKFCTSNIIFAFQPVNDYFHLSPHSTPLKCLVE